MKEDLGAPRRIIVKKAHGGGHHGGAWKVAYADFVTTMMALFIVLWIIGQGASLREAIAKYFRDPGVFKPGGSNSVNTGGQGILVGERAPGGEKDFPSEASREEAALQAAAQDIKKHLEAMPNFETVKDQIKVELTHEGLRIELAERDSSPFFRVGSAAMLDSARSILDDLARVLARLPNRITVEGHTDSRHYSSSRVYSNWELSTDRANSARRVLETLLPPGRVDRVVGFADNLLVLPDDPLNARNRRITIIVRRHDAPATIGATRAMESLGPESGTNPATPPGMTQPAQEPARPAGASSG